MHMRVLVFLFLASLASPARAHDFWIEPDVRAPKEKTRLALRLIIGHGADRTEFPRDPRHVRRFRCHGPTRSRNVPGIPGRVAGMLWVREPGLHVLSYESNASDVRLTSDEFADYLEEEGLGDARLAYECSRLAGVAPAAQVAAGAALASRKAGIVHEAFSRCAKALVAGRGDSDGAHDRIVGLPLEIVPLRNPMQLQPNQPLPVRVLLAGVPLVGARVAAYRVADPGQSIEARTNERGVAELTVRRPGFWVVKCVHITPTPGGPADWRSLWATLTFEHGIAPARAPARAYGK
jgi:hypothetical protein